MFSVLNKRSVCVRGALAIFHVQPLRVRTVADEHREMVLLGGSIRKTSKQHLFIMSHNNVQYQLDGSIRGEITPKDGRLLTFTDGLTHLIRSINRFKCPTINRAMVIGSWDNEK
jgi:hypothetical protein